MTSGEVAAAVLCLCPCPAVLPQLVVPQGETSQCTVHSAAEHRSSDTSWSRFPRQYNCSSLPTASRDLCSICCCSGVVLCTALMALLCQARELNLATKWASTSLSLIVSILRLLGLDFPAAFNDTILVACPLQLCPHSAYPN